VIGRKAITAQPCAAPALQTWARNGAKILAYSYALSRASTLVTLTHALVVRHVRGRTRQWWEAPQHPGNFVLAELRQLKMKTHRVLKTSCAALCALLLLPALAQAGSGDQLPEQYIAKWKDVAVRKMHEHGIPASITLAQGLLESHSGNSILAVQGNNHFGIKCTPDWSGGKVYHDDDKKNDCFRKYRNGKPNIAGAFADGGLEGVEVGGSR